MSETGPVSLLEPEMLSHVKFAIVVALCLLALWILNDTTKQLKRLADTSEKSIELLEQEVTAIDGLDAFLRKLLTTESTEQKAPPKGN